MDIYMVVLKNYTTIYCQEEQTHECLIGVEEDIATSEELRPKDHEDQEQY